MKSIPRSGRIQKLHIYLRSSLWFVPLIIIFGSIAAAFILVEIDQHFDQDLRQWSPRIFAMDSEGARSMLSAIAGAMATVAGVVFSITVVALTLASSQYTSRVLRNFMRDPVNQIMLGIFIGVYLYCLFVLRTISGGNGGFVPSIAVLAALIMAIFASVFFIFFIHHISSTIQASEMAAAITRETLKAVDVLFPEEIGEEQKEEELILAPDARWYGIPSDEMGYVQGVDTDALLDFASKHDTVVRMECKIGDFIAQDRPLASLALRAPPGPEIVDSLNQIYAIDTYRTVDQDAAFGIRQLVDMSLKALSPGVNDTTTAVTCIDHLSVILTRCARRRVAQSCRYEGERLRVIAAGPEFAHLVSLSFTQILENAESNAEIMLRLLIALGKIVSATSDTNRRQVLKRHIDEIEEISRQTIKSTLSMEKIEATLETVHQQLDNTRYEDEENGVNKRRHPSDLSPADGPSRSAYSSEVKRAVAGVSAAS